MDSLTLNGATPAGPRTKKRGRPFQPGQPKIGGRRPGAQNRVTLEAREVARRLVGDRRYQRDLLRRLRSRKLHPAVEVMLWHYAHGKPKETLEVSGAILNIDPAKMSDAELTAALGTAFAEMKRLADQEEQPAIDVPALPAPVEAEPKV